MGDVDIPTAAIVLLCLTLPTRPVRSTYAKGFAPYSFILKEVQRETDKYLIVC